MGRKIWLIIGGLVVSGLCFAQIQPSLGARLKRQKNMAKWEIPGADYSGITCIGGDRYAVVSDKQGVSGKTADHRSGDRYAVVSDKQRGEGFYVFSISIDSVKGKIRDVRLLAEPAVNEANQQGLGANEANQQGLGANEANQQGLGANEGNQQGLGANEANQQGLGANEANQQGLGVSSVDAEDVAFVPTRQTVFVADEGHQRIMEYDLDGRATGRELLIPTYLSVDSIYSNYGFESLTYSPKDSLLWTVTEHTLKKDGKRSGPSNPVECLLRLQSFNPETCQPVSQHYYKTDAPTAKKQGRFYAFGVSALTALEDGTLLLMEREFYVSKKYLGSWVNIKVYRVDLQQKTPDGCLHKELVVAFKNRLNVFQRTIANYEGMCLGPKLADGRQTILLVSDSQHNFGNRYFHLKDKIRVLHLFEGRE